jgi:sigma-B regulation protein RsbU (phosphoserine phosphatase)
MKIRYRLLVLLLGIALVPQLLGTAFYGVSVLNLGHRLAAETREQLLDDTFTLLRTLVDKYAQIYKRDEAQLLLALQFQAHEVERRLAAPGINQLPQYYSADYEDSLRQPEDLKLSNRHFRPTAEGGLEAIPVSYAQQVIFLAAGVDSQAVAADVKRLASMPEIYRLIYDIRPDLFLWQYTALEVGFHTSYPGKGGYPLEYDPRRREWYVAAKERGGPVSKVVTDLSTRNLILTLSMPVYRPDKSFAGVTAIDVVYHWLFTDWTIPEPWQKVADPMVLMFNKTAQDPARVVEIVYRRQQPDRRDSWQLPVKKEFLQCDDPEQFAAILADLRAGVPNIRQVRYRGVETLWAYGAQEAGFPFPLISIPYDAVVQQAVMAEAMVHREVKIAVALSTIFLVLVLLVVFALAFSRSRTISLPIQQLAMAARRLSQGHFDTQVNIQTADELQDLGATFNAMSASLREREQMMRSMALAREIQQHLLPDKSPQLAGFEILGRSHYCEDTGGDYYDFIDFNPPAHPRLGIVVADVSGHGIGAALLMTTARGMLRTLAATQKTDLGTLICTLNRHLTRDTRDDAFMTFFYALLDSETRTCRWISAGHGPVFYYQHSSDNIVELPVSGIPLGILEETVFDSSPPLLMAAGDILLVGTDGIWETTNLQGEQFGAARLKQLLQLHCLLPVEEIYTKVLQEISHFRGKAPQTDDITLVVIKAV